MEDRKIEELARVGYRQWKTAADSQPRGEHLSEEDLACLLEAKLSAEEERVMQEHLLHCGACMEHLTLALSLQRVELKEVPAEILVKVNALSGSAGGFELLEIIMRLKDKTLELINTTGDVLVGHEFLPAPVLRSRSLKDFKDQVIILKDFKDIRVEVKVDSKQGGGFNLHVLAKDKHSQKPLKDLRITLKQDDTELESYVVDTSGVIFEHLLLGRYSVVISNLEADIASIAIDIKA